MPVSDNDRSRVDAFFAAIAQQMAGYQPSFNFVAIRGDADFVLLQARLYLNTGVMPARRHVQTANVRSGVYPITDLGGDPRAVVDRLLSGVLTTPDGDLHFRARDDGVHGAAYMPFNPQDLQSQNRLHLLNLVGATQTHLLRPDIDWELRAAPAPYDGLQELMLEHQLGSLRTDVTSVEVIAFHVAAADLNRRVSGTKAQPAVMLAHGLSRDKVTLGFRVALRTEVIRRGSVVGANLTWIDHANFQAGSMEIDVPEGAAVDCVASYDGQAQHHGWIADPSTAQNPRRAIYEGIDPELTLLRELLMRTGRGRDARQFEVGVAWLAWMLGFNVAHFGKQTRFQDGPDLIAATPGGHFAVVECTTGTLKTDNKLPLLVQRATTTRNRLDASGNRHLRVLPVMVTSLSREEVRADLDQAVNLGVAVVTREDLDANLTRTLVLPDAEQLYVEAEREVQNVRDRLNAQGSLPLGSPQPM